MHGQSSLHWLSFLVLLARNRRQQNWYTQKFNLKCFFLEVIWSSRLIFNRVDRRNRLKLSRSIESIDFWPGSIILLNSIDFKVYMVMGNIVLWFEFWVLHLEIGMWTRVPSLWLHVLVIAVYLQTTLNKLGA